MKKIIILALVLSSLAAASAEAMTFWVGGVLMGTVCRNGAYYISYPMAMAQPVGSVCPVRDGYGNTIGTGVVTNE